MVKVGDIKYLENYCGEPFKVVVKELAEDCDNHKLYAYVAPVDFGAFTRCVLIDALFDEEVINETC